MRIKNSVLLSIALIAGAVITAGCTVGAADSGRTRVEQPEMAAAEKTGGAITAADIGERQAWGAVKNVVAVKHLYLSGQPDRSALKAAADHGVGVVIDLRSPDERSWDEKSVTADLGLTYYNLPIARTGPGFDSDNLVEIGKLVGKHRDTKILLHCSSGNRAGAWFAMHLVRDHGMPVESSIRLSQRAGLTNAGMQSRVRKFLLDDSARDSGETAETPN